jgi:O-antigen ligase
MASIWLIFLPNILKSSITIGEILLYLYFLYLVISSHITVNINSVLLLLFFSSVLIISLYLGGEQTEIQVYSSIRYFFVMLGCCVIYALIKVDGNEEYFLKAILYTVPIHALLVLIQYWAPTSYFGVANDAAIINNNFNLHRYSGGYANPNSLAGFSLILTPICVYYRKWIMLGLLFFLLISTFSKMMFLFPILIILSMYIINKSRLQFVIGILLSACLLLLFTYISNDLLSEIMASRFEKSNSVDSRLLIIKSFLDDYDITYIFGKGAFSDLIEGVGRIHNRFIAILIQFGIIPFIAITFSIIYFLLNIFNAYMNNADKYYLIIGLTLIAFIMVSSFSTLTFYLSEYLIFVYILFYLTVNRNNEKDG